MSRDSSYSSVHFSHYNQASFMESWKDYHLEYDDINTSRLFEETASMFPQFLLEDDEDGAIPLNSSIFGAKVYKNRHKNNVWTDLNVDVLRSSPPVKKLPDNSILRTLHAAENEPSLSDFLANGYNIEHPENADVSVSNLSHDDIWLNTTSEFSANHTFSNLKMRTNSGSYPAPVQTPRVGKTRQPSQEKFQTPITRIMR